MRHITGLTPTWLRPTQLGQLVWMFLRQRYHGRRSLYILDDAGILSPRDESGTDEWGDQWRWVLESQEDRFTSLGAKRNACAARAAAIFDPDGFVCCDDDDGYFYRHFSDAAEALDKAEWSLPSRVLQLNPDGSWRQHLTGPGTFFHGGMSFRREAFERAGGYPEINHAEDQGLFRRLEGIKATIVDPIADFRPPTYFWTGCLPQMIPHASNVFRPYDQGNGGYASLGAMKPNNLRALTLNIAPPPYNTEKPTIYKAVLPRPF